MIIVLMLEQRKISMFLRAAPSTQENGSTANVMDKAPSSGPMAQNTKVTGRLERQRALGSSCTLTEKCITVNGKMTRPMDLGFTRTRMVASSLVI